MTNFTVNKLPNNLIKNLNTSNKIEANRLICKYDGMVSFIENPNILTSILAMQEAVLSSNIEGTIATISDILDYNVGDKIDSEVIIDDVAEIKTYEEALKYLIEEMQSKNYKFSTSLFKNIQAILLNNSRGSDKLRGAFKQKQNYIGNKYENKITYTPVSPVLTNDYMENLVEFINDESNSIDPILKIAIIHAQFELIHPFEDGNGRVGRIIVPILLKKFKVIDSPFFYVSYFLAKNRDSYIEALENISQNNEEGWQNWVNFFFKSITEQSKILIAILKDLNEVAKETKEKIKELKTIFAEEILDFLFQKIKFDTSYFIKKTKINPNTARVLLKAMVENDIISVERSGSGTKSSIYKFDALYEIIKKMEA